MSISLLFSSVNSMVVCRCLRPFPPSARRSAKVVFQFLDLTEQPKSNLFQFRAINGQARDPGLPGSNGHGARGVKGAGFNKVKNPMLFSITDKEYRSLCS